MPCERRYPRQAAEAARAFLMLRLGLHLGLRQKNLRQLLVCPVARRLAPSAGLRTSGAASCAGATGTAAGSADPGGGLQERRLLLLRRQALPFGAAGPRRLYERLERYILHQRRLLLGPAEDPGTLFVKTVKLSSRDAAYDQNTFYEAWRLAIQRYGIFNPTPAGR